MKKIVEALEIVSRYGNININDTLLREFEKKKTW